MFVNWRRLSQAPTLNETSVLDRYINIFGLEASDQVQVYWDCKILVFYCIQSR